MLSSNFIRYVYKNGEFTEHTEKDKYYNFKWEVDGTMAAKTFLKDKIQRRINMVEYLRETNCPIEKIEQTIKKIG